MLKSRDILVPITADLTAVALAGDPKYGLPADIAQWIEDIEPTDPEAKYAIAALAGFHQIVDPDKLTQLLSDTFGSTNANIADILHRPDLTRKILEYLAVNTMAPVKRAIFDRAQANVTSSSVVQPIAQFVMRHIIGNEVERVKSQIVFDF